MEILIFAVLPNAPNQALRIERPKRRRARLTETRLKKDQGDRQEITGKNFAVKVKKKKYYIEQGDFPVKKRRNSSENKRTKKKRPIVKYRTFQWRPPSQIYK